MIFANQIHIGGGLKCDSNLIPPEASQSGAYCLPASSSLSLSGATEEFSAKN